MTVASATNYASYTPDNVQFVFAVPFSFPASGDLKIVVTTNGVPVQKTLGSDYLVNGAGDPNGGNITFFVAPTGTRLEIFRWLDLLQPTSLPTNGDLPAKNIERMVDRVMMVCQQLALRTGGIDFVPAAASLMSLVTGDSTAWDAQGRRLANLAAPASANDAARKADVDAIQVAEGNMPTPSTPGQDTYMLMAIAGAMVLVAPAVVRAGLLLGDAALRNIGTAATNVPEVLNTGKLDPDIIPASDVAAATLTAAGIVELATAAEVTTGTDADRVVSPATAGAHKSAVKAKARIFGESYACTYTRSSTVVTVTKAGHGFNVGAIINVAAATHTVLNGTRTITGVTTNTFTFANADTNTTSGSFTVNFGLMGGAVGVSSISRSGNQYTITFTTAFADICYAAAFGATFNGADPAIVEVSRTTTTLTIAGYRDFINDYYPVTFISVIVL